MSARRAWPVLLLTAPFLACTGSAPPQAASVRVDLGAGSLTLVSGSAVFVVDPSGHVDARLGGPGQPLSLDAPGGRPHSIRSAGREISGFVFDLTKARVEDRRDELGPGRRLSVSGTSPAWPALECELVLEALEGTPGLLLARAVLHNRGGQALALDDVVLFDRSLEPGLWSFQGASEEIGRPEVMPMIPGFGRSNRYGELASKGVGGGIPVVAFWNARGGFALGHLDKLEALLSLPVRTDPAGRVFVAAVVEAKTNLTPGQAWTSPQLFLAAHRGDYYDALRLYADTLRRRSGALLVPPAEAHEASWSSWGFRTGVTATHMRAALPKVLELGIRWAVLDDGWFGAYGDWDPHPRRFPGQAVRDVAGAYHAAGVKLKLWWLPLAVENGPAGTFVGYRRAKVLREHRDWLILDEDGRPAEITRRLASLCPALPEVRERHRALVRRFLGEWDFDGLKLDAVFTVPRCHNPAHGHASPADSVNAVPGLYRAIAEEAQAIKPGAVIRICSCATPPNHAWLPFLNQPVTGDPDTPLQQRQRVKMLKALLGPAAPVFGDDVELIGDDFASTIGTGAVPGTRFAWPKPFARHEELFLSAQKQVLFARWLSLHERDRLSEGRFHNLYVTGFDRPEAYAVEKAGRMHYAFFTDDAKNRFDGLVELRGLRQGRHRVRDRETGQELGLVSAEAARISLSFQGHLLLVTEPMTGAAAP